MDDGELETDKLILFYIRRLITNATSKEKENIIISANMAEAYKFSSTVERRKKMIYDLCRQED